MGKGYQSIPAFAKDAGSLQDALGVTQFSGEDKWAQIIGGLQIQGGLLTASGAVEFHAPYETQVLGVFVNNGTPTDVTLTGFTSPVDGYWWAIGV